LIGHKADHPGARNSSGSLAMFTPIRCANIAGEPALYIRLVREYWARLLIQLSVLSSNQGNALIEHSSEAATASTGV